MKNDPKTKFEKAKKDGFNSTYLQKIHFTNGKTLKGYSANSGFSEKNNKDDVLINWILRMYKIGYLQEYYGSKDEIDCIEYYLNNRSGEILICRLTYDYFEAFEVLESHPKIINFLDSFYESLDDKKLSAEQRFLLFYQNDKSPTIELMDYKTKRFLTQKSLQKYLSHCFDRKKMSMAQIQEFERKYIEFHKIR